MSRAGQIATLRHDRSMADVDRLAREAVSAARWGGTDYEDRFEAAWFGVVEALYIAESPTDSDLRLAGMQAVTRLANQVRNAHGLDARRDYQPGRQFQKFWASTSSPTQSHEESVVERLALPEVLAVLTPVQYEALAAAAVHPTLRSAALALGISYNTFQRRYYDARNIVRRLWFSPDRPRGDKATAAACKSGHARAEHWRTAPDGHGYCGECQRLALRRRRARGERGVA